MAVKFRAVRDDEFSAFVSMLQLTAGQRLNEEALGDARSSYDVSRTLAAFEDGVMVAGTGSEQLELTVPGPATVPATRITHTGVLPTHRRRGLALELFARQLREHHDRGEAIAMFTTSGPGVYQPVGYAPASWAVEVEIETAHVRLGSNEDTGVVRILQPDEFPIIQAAFHRHRHLQPGQVLRTDAFWSIWLADRAQYRPTGSGERFCVVAEDNTGEVQGYLCYRLVSGHPRDRPIERMVIDELVASTAAARRSLWSYCFRFEQAAVASAANVPLDDPVYWMVSDPRRVRIARFREFLWLRLVDVAAALAARRYGSSDELILDIADAVVPENSGRFSVAGGPDVAARCKRTSRSPDLAVGAAGLGAVYLGGHTFTALAAAGRVTEFRTGAAARADAMFRSSPLPWTVTDW